MSVKRREGADALFKVIFKGTGLAAIALLGAIFFMLVYNSVAFFLKINPIDFFTGSQWNPGNANGTYSIFTLPVRAWLLLAPCSLLCRWEYLRRLIFLNLPHRNYKRF
jgi:phosphate transport system permease protein